MLEEEVGNFKLISLHYVTHLLSIGIYSTKSAFMKLAINTEHFKNLSKYVCVCVCVHMQACMYHIYGNIRKNLPNFSSVKGCEGLHAHCDMNKWNTKQSVMHLWCDLISRLCYKLWLPEEMQTETFCHVLCKKHMLSLHWVKRWDEFPLHSENWKRA